MFWVLQKNLYNENAFTDLLEQLDRQNVRYQIVDVIPFAHEMSSDVNVEGPVFVLGSTAMGTIARKKGWKPGYIDANINYHNLVENYDKFCLNVDCIFTTLNDVSNIHIPWSEFFIRPVNDGKSFTGMVMNIDELKEWIFKIKNLEVDNSYASITLNDEIVISPIKEIYAEYRFFIINGRVVTGSQYKLGNRVTYRMLQSGIDLDVFRFAQMVIHMWQPNQAFALDIVNTPNGYKVLEINSINSAGFYACDMGKFIHAMEFMMKSNIQHHGILI
jgi:hypothetical protein